MENFKRVLHNPAYESIYNEDGEYLNTGSWIPEDGAEQILNENGYEWHELIHDYEFFHAPQFDSNYFCSKGLWTFPDWYILVETHYDEVLPHLREYAEDPDEPLKVPYTTVVAIRRPPPEDEKILLDPFVS